MKKYDFGILEIATQSLPMDGHSIQSFSKKTGVDSSDLWRIFNGDILSNERANYIARMFRQESPNAWHKAINYDFHCGGEE